MNTLAGDNDPFYHKYIKYKNKYLELKDVADLEGGSGKMSGQCVILFSSDNTNVLNKITDKTNKMNEHKKAATDKKRIEEEEKYNQLKNKKFDSFEDFWRLKLQKEKLEDKFDKDAKLAINLYDKYSDLEVDLESKGFIGKIKDNKLYFITSDNRMKLINKVYGIINVLNKLNKNTSTQITNANKKLNNAIASTIKSTDNITKSLVNIKGLDSAFETLKNNITEKIQNFGVSYRETISKNTGEINTALTNSTNDIIKNIEADLQQVVEGFKFPKPVNTVKIGKDNVVNIMQNLNKDKGLNYDSYLIVNITGKGVKYESHQEKAIAASSSSTAPAAPAEGQPAAEPAAINYLNYFARDIEGGQLSDTESLSESSYYF